MFGHPLFSRNFPIAHAQVVKFRLTTCSCGALSHTSALMLHLSLWAEAARKAAEREAAVKAAAGGRADWATLFVHLASGATWHGGSYSNCKVKDS